MKKAYSLDASYPTDIGKRSFIKSCSLAVFASTFSYHRAIAQLSPTEKLLSTLNNRQSAKLIGLAVLGEVEYGLQAVNLPAIIIRDLNLTNADLNLISKTDLSELLAQQNSADFDLNRIINVRGWGLGLTEARLCALAAQYN